MALASTPTCGQPGASVTISSPGLHKLAHRQIVRLGRSGGNQHIVRRADPLSPACREHRVAQRGQAAKRRAVPVQRQVRVQIGQELAQLRRLRQRQPDDRFGLRLGGVQQILEQGMDLAPSRAGLPIGGNAHDGPEGTDRGRPVSLAVLDYGLFQVHANGRIIGIVGFLIRTDRDEVVLVDTGFPAAYAQDAEAASLADGLGSFGVVLDLTERHLPQHQLGLLGLTPADVDLLILTHSHIDHVGGIAGFPQAPDPDRRRRPGRTAPALLRQGPPDGLARPQLSSDRR